MRGSGRTVAEQVRGGFEATEGGEFEGGEIELGGAEAVEAAHWLCRVQIRNKQFDAALARRGKARAAGLAVVTTAAPDLLVGALLRTENPSILEKELYRPLNAALAVVKPSEVLVTGFLLAFERDEPESPRASRGESSSSPANDPVFARTAGHETIDKRPAWPPGGRFYARKVDRTR